MARIALATEEAIEEAAALLRAGGLVAFPTETVYGLGANALDSTAIENIFRAKGRPATNPLIVHIGDLNDLENIAWESHRVTDLAARFWPGPLTMVLRKKPVIPDIVTAGGATVAVRMPAHPVALALIRAAGVPIAAPSANRSQHISPTLAHHVAASLGDAVDMILDGGPCQVGLESTVIDLTGAAPRLLRSGMVLPSEIEAVLKISLIREADTSLPTRSPGQLRRHYAPHTPLRVIRDTSELSQIEAHPLGLLAFSSNILSGLNIARVIVMPTEPAAYAARLYEALHEMDEAGLALIVVEDVPYTEPWLAVRDRLSRAGAAE